MLALRILRGPLYFALGLCAGVSVYFTLPFEPGLTLLVLASLLVLGATAWLRRHTLPYAFRVFVIVSTGAAIGLLLAKCQTELASRPVLTHTIGPTMVEGWVTGIEPGKNGARLRIDVSAISGESTATMPQKIRLTHSLSLNVGPGRHVRCWAVIRPPPRAALPGDYNFSRHAYLEGLDGVGYVQGRCKGGVLSAEREGLAGVQSRIAQFRRQLALHVDKAAGERAGGLAAALTSGDRSFMSEADTEALRGSGLAHLLAISGLHLGLISGLIFFAVRRGLALWEWLALRFPVQKIAAGAAITGAAAYLVISGASISTQRAFIMAAVFFGAILLDRSPVSLRTFSVAMIAVILIHPHSVMSPGFQMSFAATGGLIASFEAWTKRRNARGEYGGGMGFVMKSLVLSSFIGAAATAPFALYHFDRVAPLGLAANLLAMPIVTFVSAPSAGLAFLTWPLGLSDLFLSIFGWSLERVLSIAEWASDAGGEGMGLGEAMPQSAFLALVAGLIVCCLAGSMRRVAGTVLATLIIAAGLSLVAPKMLLHISQSGDAYVRNTQGSVERYQLKKGTGLAPLRYADLDPTGRCDNDVCDVETDAGMVVIGIDTVPHTPCESGAATIIIGDRFDGEKCMASLETAKLVYSTEDAPLTVYRNIFGKLWMRTPTCGHRPWLPCLRDED